MSEGPTRDVSPQDATGSRQDPSPGSAHGVPEQPGWDRAPGAGTNASLWRDSSEFLAPPHGVSPPSVPGSVPGGEAHLEPAESADAPAPARAEVVPVPAASHGEARSVEGTLKGMFGRDTVYLVIWVVQIVVAAGATPIVTRLLGAEEFGEVAAATAIMQVLFVLAGCGLQVAVPRWFAGHGGTEAAARLLTLALLVATSVTAAAMVTGPLWSSLLGFRGFNRNLQLAVLWAGASAVTITALALLRSQDKLLGFALASLMQSVVSVVLSLGFLVLWRSSSVAYLDGQLLAQLLAVGVAVAFAPPRWLHLRDLPLARAGLLFALPLVPAALGNFVLNVADRLMVQDVLGVREVARYQVAYNIGDLPMLVLGALTSIWLPRFFAAAEEERQAVLAASRAALQRLLAPVMAGLSVASPIVLLIWAPREFHPLHLTGVTAIIILSAVPFTAVQSATRDLLGRGATKPVAWSTVVAAVVNIGLNVVLIPAFGIRGAAGATLLAFAAQHAVLLLATGWHRTPGSDRAAPVWLAVAGGLTIAVVFLPTSPAGLLFRFLLALGCLAWLGRVFLSMTRARAPRGEERPGKGIADWGRRLRG